MSKKNKAKKNKVKQRAARIGVEKRKADGTWIAHQKYARSRLPHEAVMRGSKKGALTVVQKYGERALMQFARNWRLDHPSEPERKLLHLLSSLGYIATSRDEDGMPRQNGMQYYLREDPCGNYLLDTYFPVLRCAVEVDGKPPEWMDDQRLDFELRRIQEIRAHGTSIIQIRAEHIDRPETLQRIKDFLLTDAPKPITLHPGSAGEILDVSSGHWKAPGRYDRMYDDDDDTPF